MERVIDLDRRISNQIGKGKGIRFSQDELDLLVIIGAIDVVKAAAAAALKRQVELRQQERAARQVALAEGSTSRRTADRENFSSEMGVSAATKRAQRTSRKRADHLP